MIEVFKTNLNDTTHANDVLHKIHVTFPEYQANFDLEDCDRILRVRNLSGDVDSYFVICMLNRLGWNAEILSDDEPPHDGTKDLASNLLLDEA
jgi:hypothetical protein